LRKSGLRWALQQVWQLCTDLTGLLRVLKPKQALHYYGLFIKNLVVVLRRRSLGPIDVLAGTGPFEVKCKAGWAKLTGYQMMGIVREIWVREIYLGHGFLEIKPESVVIDLGANVGGFTVFGATFAKKGRVLSVEAQGHMLEGLKQNLKQNNLTERVTILHGMVGANSGIITTMQANTDIASNTYSIADLRQMLGNVYIDFLKMDIEGSEFDLFAREPHALDHVGQLAAEIHLDYGKLETIQQLCEKQGFTCRTTKLGNADMHILYARRLGK
jgi:FkbM family methyltransferase